MNRRTTLTVSTAAALLLTGAVSACSVDIGTGGGVARGDEVTEARDVTAVTRVELRTTGTLNLAVGDEPALSVTARESVLDDIETEVQGDTLIIDMDRGWHRPGHLEYNLVLPALSTVVLAGSGEVYGELGATDEVELRIDGSGEVGIDDLTATEVTLDIRGSGAITLRDVTAEDLGILVDGSGNVDVAGTSDHLTVAIPGSGGVEAGALTARTGEVSIDGSGEALVNVSDTLDATIGGSGEITYLGDPDVDEAVDGSGDVRQG